MATARTVELGRFADAPPQQVDSFESERIARALKGSNGNAAMAAEQLGIPKKTLYDKLQKHQLPAGPCVD